MSIETRFDVAFVAAMARREKQIQQNYRPIIAVHKWFARRPGTLCPRRDRAPRPCRVPTRRRHSRSSAHGRRRRLVRHGLSALRRFRRAREVLSLGQDNRLRALRRQGRSVPRVSRRRQRPPPETRRAVRRLRRPHGGGRPQSLARYAAACARWMATSPEFVPQQPIPPGDETDRLHRWGYRRYRELFNPRQLLGLELSARHIATLDDERIRRALATNSARSGRSSSPCRRVTASSSTRYSSMATRRSSGRRAAFARIQHLYSLSRRELAPDQPSRFDVVACIGGRGFKVRREDMKKLLLSTRGRVFTLQNLDRLVDSSRLAGFRTRGDK